MSPFIDSEPLPPPAPGLRRLLGVSMRNEPSEGRRPPGGADKFIIPVWREVEPENDESIILKRQVRPRSPYSWGVAGFTASLHASWTEDRSSRTVWSAATGPRLLLCLLLFSGSDSGKEEELGGGGGWVGVPGEGTYQYSGRTLSKKQLPSHGSVSRPARPAALHGC